MDHPKLTLPALALVLMVLCTFACKKDRSDDPPSTTTTTSPASPVTADCSNAANSPAKVVCLSNAFLSTLNAGQLSSAQIKLSQTSAVHWSNLPCGAACRNGLEFVSMTPAQIAAAKAILEAATGTGNDEGYSAIDQIMQADSANNYFISFLGTPSLSGSWQLQFGGHNLALNITYTNGVVKGPTPLFQGGEPHSGNTIVKGGIAIHTPPLASLRSAMTAMLASLSSDQLAGARLNTVFSDVLLAPGADGKFPFAKAGLDVSSLSTPQQDLILAAIKAAVLNDDSATAAAMITRYTLELSETYISFSNTPYLSSINDYVRIDGPSVWIEFICKPGETTQSEVFYNSVWRDHKRDYGANFIF